MAHDFNSEHYKKYIENASFFLSFSLSASECKPCPEFSAIPDSRSVTPDGEASPPSAGPGEMFFLAEEKVNDCLLIILHPVRRMSFMQG